MRMYHAAAQDLDPAGTCAETAAFASVFKAGYVHLCTWLCKREVMRTEFCLGLRSEKFFGKFFQSSLQICEGNIFVNNQAFDLMERRRMGSVHLVRTEHTSR